MVTPSGFDDWPWEINLHGMDMTHMMEIDGWCDRTFGTRNTRWRAVDNGWQTRLYDDAVMIVVAWG